MDWSNLALKGTIGAGTLCVVAVLSDVVEPYIGIWGLIVLVLVPFTILVMFRVDELPVHIIKLAHGLAVLWYVAMVLATVIFMGLRGFERTDLLLGFFMLLGLWPCGVILRGLMNGSYDRKDA